LENFADGFTLDAFSGGECVFSPEVGKIRGNSHCGSCHEASQTLVGQNGSQHRQNILERAINVKVSSENSNFLNAHL